MAGDPLSFFLNEKTAAALPDMPFEDVEQQPFSSNPDPQSLDPGERAFAGMAAVSGSAIGGAATWLGGQVLRHYAMGDVTPTSRFAEMELPSGDAPRGKLMGLFDIKARQPNVPEAAFRDLESSGKMQMGINRATSRGNIAEANRLKNELAKIKHHPVNITNAKSMDALDRMADTVDSFINRHGLEQKGVTTHLKSGPLNAIMGPRYETATKRVYLPVMNKEIALHELGHAADYTAGRMGKVRRIAEPLLHRGAQFILPTALIAGDQIAEMLPGTIDDKVIRFVQNNAPLIMGATLAATSLYPEAKASILAISHIKKTEGPKAARIALKRLGPAFGTYLLGAIPAVVGMSIAKKYMREAREEKSQLASMAGEKLQELDKESSIRSMIGDIGELAGDAYRFGRSTKRDLANIGTQIGQQTSSIVHNPGTMKRISDAAKSVGSSPEFVQGALASALPAATGALYLYGTQSGREIRKRVDPERRDQAYSQSVGGVPIVSARADEKWREENPKLFAGLVGVSAALSGGIMTKLFSDLARVL